VSLRAVPGIPGRYQADWTASAAGMYVADLTANEGTLSAGQNGSDWVVMAKVPR